MKLKLNEQTKSAISQELKMYRLGSSDGFWYDITDGGYFKPEDVLADKEQIKEVKKAIKLLRQLEDIYRDVTEEF